MIQTEDTLHSKKLGVKINRGADVVQYPFLDYFQGFETVDAVRSIFGRSTDEVLRKLKVSFFPQKFGYMGVSDIDGSLVISTHHLNTSDFKILYLDIIHELVHVKQFMDGRELFSTEYEYVDSPVEIEAYRHTVNEARRIGMNDKEIFEYLKVEWIDEDSHKRLLDSVGVKVELPRI